jgi:uncharacterized membrane protein YeaQ/YmgE (transglycosylase-associated protein family)
MNLIVWLALGSVVGWLASLVMRTGARQGVVLNIVVGFVGAFIAGWFVAPLAGIGGVNQIEFSPASVLVAGLGAVLLLAIFNLFRRVR